MKIIVTNPMYDEVYETKDITEVMWKEFIKHCENGDELIISFTDTLSKRFVTINPQNFASVEVDFNA